MDRTIFTVTSRNEELQKLQGIELEAVKLASTVLQGNFELPKVDTGERG